MRKITEEEIAQEFDARTFSKGVEYFEKGYVGVGVKKGNELAGTVYGSAPQPYKVRVEITDHIYSTCTCPVEVMCKHGVALLLQWLDDPDFFVDADRLLASLRERSKEELLKLIGSVIDKDPLLVHELFPFERIGVKKRRNIEAISRRIRYLSRGFIDYYRVPEVVRELDDVKEIGDELLDEELYEDAAEIYLMLIENVVESFNTGVDDSDDMLAEFVWECIEDFNIAAKKMREEQKSALITRIADIVTSEIYGLDTKELFHGVATRENIARIEEELLKRISLLGSRANQEYQRERILNLLQELFQRLDLPEDAVRVIKKAGLRYKSDYYMLANALLTQGKYKEAFNQVREGLDKEDTFLPGAYKLDELYFTLLEQLLDRGELTKAETDTEEALRIAMRLLSGFSPKYETIRKVFEKIGEYDKLLSTIKSECDEHIMLRVLLHDGYVDDAIDLANSSGLYPWEIIEVAEAAYEKNKAKEARRLTIKALKEGLMSVNKTAVKLIREIAENSDENELREALRSIRSAEVAETFIESLLEKKPEHATELIEKHAPNLGKEKVKTYAQKLDKKHAKKVCHSWITWAVNRSHTYYKDAIDLLKIIREKSTIDEWKEYITRFTETHSGKKKLLERIRKIHTDTISP